MTVISEHSRQLLRTLAGLCGTMFLLVLAPATGAESARCLGCHSATADEPVHALFNGPHGALAGGGDEACIACHGDSNAHRDAPTSKAPTISFGPRWPALADTRSKSCLGCHEKAMQLLWIGSDHQQEALACDSCHSLHQQTTLALGARDSDQQCMDCHPQTRAEARLPSHHPILEGKTGCTDCHNPHGSLGDALLVENSVNDTCFGCHQEKRGPFLFEHPPAAEDCSLCHRPHGSVHERLLITRGPAQCQQCHAVAFHPSVPYGAQGLAGNKPNQNLLGKNCLNCHSQVHGSNHPSGGRLAR